MFTPHLSAPVKPAMRVDVFSHHAAFSGYGDDVKHALLSYCRGLGHYGLKMVGRGQFVRAVMSVYAARTADSSEIRVHINHLHDALRHLANYGYGANTIEVVEHPLYEPMSVVFDKVTDQAPREYQIPLIQYLIATGKTKVLTLQTGKGKTFTSLKAIAELGVRTALVIKGMYVDKWVSDVYETLGLSVKEVLVVRGSKDLKTLIELAKAGQLQDIKFFIITNKTMANFYKAYERGPLEPYEYGCTPEEFYPLLGIGVRLIDEVHMEFHSNFRQDLYSHVPKTISLSATLDSDDQFINRMYGIMFPPECRPESIEYDRYIDALGLEYRITDFKRVKFIGAKQMYSHIKFEQSILRYKDLTQRYLAMITEIADTEFVKVFEPGQRMLIFCTTVEMCTALQKYMRAKYSDVMVGRYVSEDDYSVLETNDIVVTTLKSAGTAVDVSGLRVCLMTDSINSKQSNIQALGRLRPLKRWPDTSPLFIYLYANNIDKHRQYAREKQEKFAGKVRSHRTMITQYHI